ncbi:copper resistance CopC family protein [Microbacterium azadirachtae]|uniref:Copper transport protein YcnJ n=1 Tax=Microbacterium azadirachtae TaxID=582680 RepID=A0A0F0LLZ5_9MICO|nr:copper resistance protein CopC [Microbacterium azadirachtae]KJL33699.1 Copper transport protein YcnJ precursor [Microbacterium azadirachtae]
MSPFRRYAAGLALASVVVLTTASPASAHDQLVSSTPGAGEQLTVAPTSISMTFSGDLLALDDTGLGAVVLVVDDSDTNWATGKAEVVGNIVTAELKPGMPVAGYQVRWQVVSADGHPIAGVVPFTVGDADPLTAGTTAGKGSASARPEIRTNTSDQIADESGGALRVLLIGGAGAAIAALGFVLFRFLRRPRTAAATPDTGEPAADDL